MTTVLIGDWTYVTAAWEEEAVPAGWRAALVSAGFRPVGVVERRLPPLPAGPGMPVVDVPAWEREARERIGVLAGPEGRAFAVVEPYFEERLLSLRTLTAAGVVVETTVAPERQAAEPPGTLTASVFSGRGFRRWGRWLGRRGQAEEDTEAKGRGWTERLAGDEVAWIREDRPEAGYHLELLPAEGRTEAEMVARVAERHRERLATLVPEGEIPRHDNLILYLALVLRSELVTAAMTRRVEQMGRLSTYLLAGLALLLAVALPLFIFAGGGLAAASLAGLTWLGGGLLVLMALVFLAQPLLRRLAVYRTAQVLQPIPAEALVRQVARMEESAQS